MRWGFIERAKIDADLRKTFERYGVETMQAILASNGTFRGINGNLLKVSIHEQELLQWLSEQYARKDRKETWSTTIEVGVVALITLEIVLSLYGLHEGRQQNTILDDMKTSTEKTKDAIQHSTDLLKTLADEQKESVEILRRQETDRLTQIAKRPKLVLYAGNTPLAKAHGYLKPEQETETTVTFTFLLRNRGDGNSNKTHFRVLTPQDINVTGGAPTPVSPSTYFDLLDRHVRSWIYPFPEPITPNAFTQLTIVFMFTKGHPPFEVSFNADSLEIPTDTPLGVLEIHPKPASSN